MGTLFAVNRVNGKSNTEVLIDALRDAKPGDVFTYDQLGDALSLGARKFSRDETMSAMNTARDRILKALQRTFRAVRNVGYEIVPASAHTDIAGERKKRGDRQYARALLTVQHARTEEMEPGARERNDQTLILLGAICHVVRGHEKRLRRIEEKIENLGR